MGSVYLISDYGKLGKKDEALCFYYPSGEERRMFIHRTDRLVISGSVDISAAALKLLMRHKIDTVFLNKNGQFNGKLSFQDTKNVFVRKRQYEILDIEKAITELAKAIVSAKIKNQITFMQRIGRKENSEKISKTILEAQKNHDSLMLSDKLNSIRGYEGYGSRLYFSVFKENLIPSWAVFNGRNMNPPKDNVNAVLSFLYTLLMYRVDAAIESQGLDPFVGSLHTLAYGKHALTFDLMEEFRASIVDPLVCSLFNLGILKENDFESLNLGPDSEIMIEEAEDTDSYEEMTESKSAPEKGVLLSKEALKKVVAKFEEKMDALVNYAPLQERMSYQQIIYAQVEHYKRVIIEAEPKYNGFLIK